MHGRKLLILWSWIYGFMPIALRVYGYGLPTFRPDVFEIFFALFSVKLSQFFWWAFLLFVYIGWVDFNRKLVLLANWSGIISNVKTKSLVLGRHLPKLDMKNPETIIAWYSLRSIFLHFGRRFTVRIFWYWSWIVPVWLAVIVVVFL
jgi:hypothetical protein